MQIQRKLLVGALTAAILAGGVNVVALAASSKSSGQVSREAERRGGREVEPGDDRGRGIEPGDDRGREAEVRGREAEGELEFEFELDDRREDGVEDEREDRSRPSDSSGPSDNSGPGSGRDDDGGSDNDSGHGGHGSDD
jgi:hypothetical protein